MKKKRKEVRERRRQGKLFGESEGESVKVR